MEPGFYVCAACGHRWARQEYKMRANPTPECPRGCKAEQKTDVERDREYTREVYGPLAKLLTDAARKAGT